MTYAEITEVFSNAVHLNQGPYSSNIELYCYDDTYVVITDYQSYCVLSWYVYSSDGDLLYYEGEAPVSSYVDWIEPLLKMSDTGFYERYGMGQYINSGVFKRSAHFTAWGTYLDLSAYKENDQTYYLDCLFEIDFNGNLIKKLYELRFFEDAFIALHDATGTIAIFDNKASVATRWVRYTEDGQLAEAEGITPIHVGDVALESIESYDALLEYFGTPHFESYAITGCAAVYCTDDAKLIYFHIAEDAQSIIAVISDTCFPIGSQWSDYLFSKGD